MCNSVNYVCMCVNFTSLHSLFRTGPNRDLFRTPDITSIGRCILFINVLEKLLEKMVGHD